MDTLNKEKAYQQLINLKMQPGQLDEYILTFERLAGITGWDKDARDHRVLQKGTPPWIVSSLPNEKDHSPEYDGLAEDGQNRDPVL